MALINKISGLWQQRKNMGDATLSHQEIDFLPAALEIKEKPPHPATKLTSRVLITLFSIAVLWACVGEVDIVASAEGKIVPSGQVKEIQPYERGVVSRILVQEGQTVKAGDPLIILDQTQTGADSKRLQQEIEQNRINRARYRYYQDFLESYQETVTETKGQQTTIEQNQSLIWPLGSEKQMRQQQQLLSQQKESYKAEWSRLIQLQADKRAAKEVNAALINKLQGTLPLISQRASAFKKLLDKKMTARVDYLELEQERVELKYDLEAAKSTHQQLDTQIVELQQQARSFQAQSQAQNLQQLVDLDREYLNLKEEWDKANDINQKQTLISPVDGTVQELAVHTIGGVVTPAQPLMNIVPENQVLEVEAWLENKDIGFVQQGDITELKVHTFPFTKYGIIDGLITHISADATLDKQRGLIYKAHIEMKKSFLNIDGRNVNLVPGMGVSAEVKTGKRLLIEYLIAPLLRYKSESLDER